MSARLGLMGGTFDPIHHGHLVAAGEVAHQLDLDRVDFIPAGQPWQKEGTSDASHRLAMVEAAIADDPRFGVSTIEIEREGPTYTIDTLRELSGTADELVFITGADAIVEIMGWKEPEELVTLATFVAVTRPGYPIDRIRSLDLSHAITVTEVPALAISSTDIRARVARGAPITYLVPGAVERYIRKSDLYA